MMVYHNIITTAVSSETSQVPPVTSLTHVSSATASTPVFTFCISIQYESACVTTNFPLNVVLKAEVSASAYFTCHSRYLLLGEWHQLRL